MITVLRTTDKELCNQFEEKLLKIGISFEKYLEDDEDENLFFVVDIKEEDSNKLNQAGNNFTIKEMNEFDLVNSNSFNDFINPFKL